MEGVVMGISRFIRTFILTLIFAHASYAAAPDEQLKKHEAGQPIADSSTNGEVNQLNPAQPLFSRSSRRLTLIDKAYLDAHAILRENNSCSRFFGGPRISTIVLNSLYLRLETSLIENHVGISMNGTFTFVTDAETGVSYRLFKKALVNLTGPFYRSANYKSQSFFQRIGHYLANTREARVLMLLHELGHLLPGPDGRWLLPDDGNNHVQVAINTATIMSKCSEQIKSLRVQRNEVD
jgi:hypothetical protein